MDIVIAGSVVVNARCPRCGGSLLSPPGSQECECLSCAREFKVAGKTSVPNKSQNYVLTTR